MGYEGSSLLLSFPFPKANEFPDHKMDMVIPGVGHWEAESRRRQIVTIGYGDPWENKFRWDILPERHIFQPVQLRAFVHIHVRMECGEMYSLYLSEINSIPQLVR